VQVLEQELTIESSGIMRQCCHVSVFLGEEPFAKVVQAIVSLENVSVWAAAGANAQILVSALVAEAVCDAHVWYVLHHRPQQCVLDGDILSGFKIEKNEDFPALPGLFVL